MIRDPSDGTVKPPLTEEAIAWLRAEMKKPPGPDLSHEPTRKFMAGEYSGLPIDKLKADELARLERSREWIQERAERAKMGVRSTNSGED